MARRCAAVQSLADSDAGADADAATGLRRLDVHGLDRRLPVPRAPHPLGTAPRPAAADPHVARNRIIVLDDDRGTHRAVPIHRVPGALIRANHAAREHVAVAAHADVLVVTRPAMIANHGTATTATAAMITHDNVVMTSATVATATSASRK